MGQQTDHILCRTLALAAMALGAPACGKTSSPIPEACDGRLIAEGEELSLQLVSLGYEAIDSADITAGAVILTDQEAWTAQTDGLGTDGGLAPDFANDAVYVHPWIDGGCEPAFSYRGWRWGDEVRVLAFQDGEDDGCDASFPNLDLVLVHGVAGAQLDWCGTP